MKNPVMSFWLSWANRAASLWAGAAMAAARQNEAALKRAMKPRPAAKPRRTSGSRRR